jgi:AraC family transcriptional regulator
MHWVELGTARKADLADSISTYSSGIGWNGISLQEVHGPPDGEIPEGYFLHHTLVLSTSARPTTEVRLAGSGWRSVASSPMVLEFVPAGLPFALRWQRPNDAITVNLTPAFAANVLGSRKLNESHFQTWSGADGALLSQTILALAEDVRAGLPSGPLYGECLGASLVAQIARKSIGPQPESLARSKGLAPKLLRTLLDDIDANLEGDLSLQRLAGLAGVSLDGFIRLFKKSTGVPPHQFVLRKRVERAQALLGNPALSLAEVALRAGFADQSHFSRMFHRLTGIAPRQYRHTLR